MERGLLQPCVQTYISVVESKSPAFLSWLHSAQSVSVNELVELQLNCDQKPISTTDRQVLGPKVQTDLQWGDHGENHLQFHLTRKSWPLSTDHWTQRYCPTIVNGLAIYLTQRYCRTIVNGLAISLTQRYCHLVNDLLQHWNFWNVSACLLFSCAIWTTREQETLDSFDT